MPGHYEQAPSTGKKRGSEKTHLSEILSCEKKGTGRVCAWMVQSLDSLIWEFPKIGDPKVVP